MRTFGALLALAVACGGEKNVRRGGGPEDAPPWLSQGTGAVSVESGRKLQGVGVARNSDPRLRREAADNAASQQFDRGVDTFAAGLAKLTESTREKATQEVSAIARKAAHAVPHVRDHWVTPEGAENALDQVDLAAFKQALQSVDGDDNLKREMWNNAGRAFDQLAKQER